VPTTCGVRDPAAAADIAPRTSEFIACSAGAHPNSTAVSMETASVNITIRGSSVNVAQPGA
jgi:hypothetical protein